MTNTENLFLNHAFYRSSYTAELIKDEYIRIEKIQDDFKLENIKLEKMILAEV
jgi:hypothetical protein